MNDLQPFCLHKLFKLLIGLLTIYLIVLFKMLYIKSLHWYYCSL